MWEKIVVLKCHYFFILNIIVKVSLLSYVVVPRERKERREKKLSVSENTEKRENGRDRILTKFIIWKPNNITFKSGYKIEIQSPT